MTKLTSLLFIPAIAACTTSSSPTTVSNGTLMGSVEGQAWTFKTGVTDSFLSSGDTYFAELYSSAFNACTDQPPTEPHVIVELPKTPGNYPMSLSRNMTFTDGMSDNKIATDGLIVVGAVTATQITGGLNSTYDGNNDVDGQFTVTVCPPQQ